MPQQGESSAKSKPVPRTCSRQMVQGQTAQKFFTYDEGDVWWHPGHWRGRNLALPGHYRAAGIGGSPKLGNPNENFRRHCSGQMGRNPLWPRSSDSGSSALKPQTASCIPTFRAQTFRRTTDGGGGGRQRRREAGREGGQATEGGRRKSTVASESHRRREGGKEGGSI